MSLLIDLGNFVRQLLPALTAERRARAQEFLGGVEAADADREMAIGRRLIREDYGLEPAQRQEFESHLAGLPDPKQAAQEIIADDLLSYHFGIQLDAVQRHRGELMQEFVKERFGVEEAVDEDRFAEFTKEYYFRKEADEANDGNVEKLFHIPELSDVARRMKELDETQRTMLVRHKDAPREALLESQKVYKLNREVLNEEARQILTKRVAATTGVRPDGDNRSASVYFKINKEPGSQVLSPAPPPTLDDVLHAEVLQQHGPEDIARAVKSWRDQTRSYGEKMVGGQDVEGFWMGAQRLDDDVRDVLGRLATMKWMRAHFVTAGGSWDHEFYRAWQHNPEHAAFDGARQDWEALMKSEAFSSPARNRDWLPIQSPSGNEVGRFQLRRDGDDVEMMLNLPQQEEDVRFSLDPYTAEATAEWKEVQPPDLKVRRKLKAPTEEDVTEEIAKADREIAEHREKIKFWDSTEQDFVRVEDLPWWQATRAGEMNESVARTEAVREKKTREHLNEIAELEQRKQALQKNGFGVLVTERLMESLKADPHLKDKVGRRDLWEDMERGFARWVGGMMVTGYDIKGDFTGSHEDRDKRDEWMEHLRNLPLYYEGSSNREIRGGVHGFLREGADVMGGMAPQAAAMLMMPAMPVAAVPWVQGLSMGSLVASSYGQQLTQIHAQVQVLRDRAQALTDAGDAQGAAALSEQANFAEDHARGLAALHAAAEGVSEFILPEERLLLRGSKSMGRRLTVDGAKSFLEGSSATVLQAPGNAVIGIPTSPEDVLRAGVGELIGGAPMVGAGIAFGHERGNPADAGHGAPTSGNVSAARSSASERSYAELQQYAPATLSDGSPDPAKVALQHRAEALRAIKEGKPLGDLSNEQLASLGYQRDAQDPNKVTALEGIGAPPPVVTFDKDGKPVIRPEAVEELRAEFPETAALVSGSEGKGSEGSDGKEGASATQNETDISSTPTPTVAATPSQNASPTNANAAPKPIRPLPAYLDAAGERERANQDATLTTAERLAGIEDLMLGMGGTKNAQARAALEVAAAQYAAGNHNGISFRTTVQRLLGSNPNFVDVFDFGPYYEHYFGPAPSSGGVRMYNPHAHHILMKKGMGSAQQALVAEGQAILREAGIDPIFGLENLIWAPMRVEGQHHTDSLSGVVNALKKLKNDGARRQDYVDKLRKLGDEAQRRMDTKKRLTDKLPKAPKAKSTQGANPQKSAAPGTTTEKPKARMPATPQNGNSESDAKSAEPANNAAQSKKKTTKNTKQAAKPEEEA